MKKIFSFILALSMVFMAYGQDARQRTVETIVADVLAQLPVQNSNDFNENFADLAKSAPQSVEIMAAMFKPLSEGNDNLLQYAVAGLVSYVTDPAHQEYLLPVNQGLAVAITSCKDEDNKAFFLRQLRYIAVEKNAPLMKECTADPELAPLALAILENLESGKEIVRNLVAEGKVEKSLLARSIANLGLEDQESVLLSWLAAGDLDRNQELAVCTALAKIGSAASLKYLQSSSLNDYAALVSRLAAEGNEKVAKQGAKILMKADSRNLKMQGTRLQMELKGEKGGLKVLTKALKDEDRAYRNTVLNDATELFGVESVAQVVNKVFASAETECQTDLVNWIGNHKQVASAEKVIASMAGKGELAQTAIVAAAKLETEETVSAVVAQLGGENGEYALKALKSVKNLDLEKMMKDAFESGSSVTRQNILSFASSKKMVSFAPTAFELVNAEDKALRAAAVKSLSGLVVEKDMEKVAQLLASAEGEEVTLLQNAMNTTIRHLSSDQKYEQVKALMEKENQGAANFYPVLAKTNTDSAVEFLESRYNAGERVALRSLAMVNNYKAAAALLSIAQKEPKIADQVLPRYITLVGAYEKNLDKKRFAYADAMSLASDVKVKSRILKALSKVPTMKAFLLAGKYLDNPEIAYDAAYAVKNIVASTKEEIDYAALKTNLEKAMQIIGKHDSADDGYAVDQMEKILQESKPSPKFELSEEEKAQGFEVLFDGTNLDKWHGDKEGYTPVNGAIYVSANYGSSGNLYTKKEYRNFVLRFEFCFLKPGVNNGVGVRTPVGVDAAYHAMCELQILDHDAPIYKNLRPYQVHGSIYGVKPAKRIVHKPLGEWSYEEIRVEGDHITVTVNGEVITDANIRKICKGHNVAPDGSNYNPYLMDHNNHPGMFNERGYVSFCGHGAGLKLRNIRILDLGDEK